MLSHYKRRQVFKNKIKMLVSTLNFQQRESPKIKMVILYLVKSTKATVIRSSKVILLEENKSRYNLY